jgi:hypothetical protein
VKSINRAERAEPTATATDFKTKGVVGSKIIRLRVDKGILLSNVLTEDNRGRGLKVSCYKWGRLRE